MVSCKGVARDQRTNLIGEYLSPSTLTHLPDPGEVLNRFLVRDLVVLGYLNADIAHLRNPLDQQVDNFLDSFGLVDLLVHF